MAPKKSRLPLNSITSKLIANALASQFTLLVLKSSSSYSSLDETLPACCNYMILWFSPTVENVEGHNTRYEARRVKARVAVNRKKRKSFIL